MEKAAGRTGGRNEPRELDIDIVSYGGSIVREATLVLPHPRFRDRAFVLVPLREVCPSFVCPETGRSVDRLMSSLSGGQRLWRVSRRGAVFA